MTDLPAIPDNPPQPTFDPNMFPGKRRPVGELILDHNPCFLLSTLCMLVGCYLLNSALDVRAGDAGKLFWLIAVMNVYEACIIGLGLALVRRRSSPARDGLWLLLFETLFLVDATFLIGETVQASAEWGWAVNVGLLGLAVVKGAAVMRGMRIPWRARTLGFLALQAAVVYLMPVGLFAVSVNGVVAAWRMYGVWWVVGLLPMAYEAIARVEPLTVGGAPLGTVQQVIRRTYVIVPWVLAAAHAGFMQWVYHADFYVADLSPVLLGLAVASLRVRPSVAASQANLAFLRVVLPAVALLLAATESRGALDVRILQMTITPTYVTLAATVIVWGYFISTAFAAVAIGSVLAAAMAYAVRLILWAAYEWLLEALRGVWAALWGLLPQTVERWGEWSIAAAFVLLLAGAALSFGRRGSSTGV